MADKVRVYNTSDVPTALGTVMVYGREWTEVDSSEAMERLVRRGVLVVDDSGTTQQDSTTQSTQDTTTTNDEG